MAKASEADKGLSLPDYSKSTPTIADLPISDAEKKALTTVTESDWLPRVMIAQKSSDVVGDKNSGIGFGDIYMKDGDAETLLVDGVGNALLAIPFMPRPKAMLIEGGAVVEESYDPTSEAFAKCADGAAWGPGKIPGAYAGVEVLCWIMCPNFTGWATIYFTGTSKRAAKPLYQGLGKLARISVFEKPGKSGPYGVWKCAANVEVGAKDVEGIDMTAVPGKDDLKVVDKYKDEKGRSHREEAGTEKDDGSEDSKTERD